ncbi:hypothetical protein ACKI16_29605 [Streptomyces scabiei]|uniref:hypothetical protein n=1 Tax=Streptomyces scabiei TaxID=1930 RepID=UPI0038F6E1BE
MSHIAKTGVYILLLVLGLSVAPAHVFNVTMQIAGIGLLCMLLLQLRSTRTRFDYALAWVALWAVVAVLSSPLVPVWHGLANLMSGAL